MNDISRTGLYTETPVNPYSLLEAVNRSSGTANTAWLIFVGLLAYLLITVAGVTHKDLLLNAAITLDAGKPNSVFHPGGTAVVIHEGKDDYKTDPAGNAGIRIACSSIRCLRRTA